MFLAVILFTAETRPFAFPVMIHRVCSLSQTLLLRLESSETTRYVQKIRKRSEIPTAFYVNTDNISTLIRPPVNKLTVDEVSDEERLTVVSCWT